MTKPLAFIDFETTGLSPEAGDRIIEVGIAVLHQGRIKDAGTVTEILSRAGAPSVLEAFQRLTESGGESVAAQP